MSKKISFIIPVYNAMTSGGGHIGRCIESVINQKDFTLDDIEIIVINDGSKDNSIEVLQEYSTKYSQMRLIDQENMGVANTRNKALTLVAGEYTTYLDQDDWIDDDFCSVMYNAAKEDEYNLVIGGYRRPNTSGKITRTFVPKNTSYGRYTISAAWAKLHKTEFLRKHDVNFFASSYGEDIPYMVEENLATDHYKIVEYVGYNWFFNEKSVSNTSQKNLSKDNLEAIKKLFVRLSELGEKVSNEEIYFMIRTAVYYLLFSGRHATKAQFLHTKEELFAMLQPLNVATPDGEDFRVKIIVRLFLWIDRLRMMNIFATVWCKNK